MNPEQGKGPDDKLFAEIAAGLRQPDDSPELWGRIESGLLEKQSRTPLEWHGQRRRKVLRTLSSLAAATLVITTLLFVLQQRDGRRPSQLTAEDEVALVEIETASVERELARLEPLFRQEMISRGQEDSPLTGHLEILDEGIETSRKAWRSNRLNRGVQQALLHGYRTKLGLLREFISAQG